MKTILSTFFLITSVFSDFSGTFFIDNSKNTKSPELWYISFGKYEAENPLIIIKQSIYQSGDYTNVRMLTFLTKKIEPINKNHFRITVYSSENSEVIETFEIICEDTGHLKQLIGNKKNSSIRYSLNKTIKSMDIKNIRNNAVW